MSTLIHSKLLLVMTLSVVFGLSACGGGNGGGASSTAVVSSAKSTGSMGSSNKSSVLNNSSALSNSSLTNNSSAVSKSSTVSKSSVASNASSVLISSKSSSASSMGGTAQVCPIDPPTGTIYYVCDCGAGASSGCVAGNDTNNGTTILTPWKTFDKARATFSTLAAGDTIAFCRGGAITTATGNQWLNTNCRGNNRCTVRDYVPPNGATNLPIITATADIQIFNLQNGGDPRHEEGYVFANLDLRGTGGSGSGVFVYNDVDDVLVCGSSFSGLGIGIHIEGANAGAGDTRNARINASGNRFLNNSGFGYLGGCDECVVENNYFEGNGDTAIYDHNLYLADSGNADSPFTNMRVSNNELYKSTMVGGKCQGVAFVVHGLYDNLLIENNYIHEDIGAVEGTCWGLAIDAASGEREGFTGVTIRGNRIENVGGMMIGINACDHCVIEDNVLVNMQNLETVGIAAPDRGRSDPDTVMTAVTIRNNSLFFGAGVDNTGILMGTEGSNHIVTSNAIHYSGTGNFFCMELDLAASAYSAINNNLCFGPNASLAWTRNVNSLATWRTNTGFDLNSAITDPGFFSVGAPYNLCAASATSAMVGKGHATLSSPFVFGGGSRGNPPDIGACQR